MIRVRTGPKINSFKIFCKDKLFDNDRLIIKITEDEIIISRSTIDNNDKANSVFNGKLGRCFTKTSEYLKPGDYPIDREDSDEDNLYIYNYFDR